MHGLDLARPLSDADIEMLESALAEHSLLILKNAAAPDVEPQNFADLVRRLNPGAETVWRDQETNPWEKFKAESSPAGTFQLPHCREVLVLGKGEHDQFGLKCMLGGARAAYGTQSGSQVIGGGKLQWHLDGAFWRAPKTRASGLPCRHVGMRCVEAPAAAAAAAAVDVDYGDGARLSCPAGATAFCSGVVAFDLLTEAEQAQARRTTARRLGSDTCDRTASPPPPRAPGSRARDGYPRHGQENLASLQRAAAPPRGLLTPQVVYAAHPFKRFKNCGMTADGLRCVGGAELEERIEGEEASGALRLPLVWRHPRTGRRARAWTPPARSIR